MIPYKPHLATCIPRTLEVRLEIAKAIQVLAAQAYDDRLRQRHAEIASIRRELEDIARDVRKLHREWPSLIRSELRKAGYDPNEPRVSAGNPDGGRWTNGGAGDFAINTDNAMMFTAILPTRTARPVHLRHPIFRLPQQGVCAATASQVAVRVVAVMVPQRCTTCSVATFAWTAP